MRRVLVLEDEEIIRHGLCKILEEVIGGYLVVAESENGRNILSLIDQFQPDLVITDIRMPGIDGLEVIKMIKAVRADLPVVILSGHADFSYACEAIKHGAKAYLLKPIDHGELAITLESLFTTTKNMNNDTTEENSNHIIREVKKIIIENLDNDLSLQSVADLVQLNNQYLSKLFKDQSGENFSHYISRLRVEKSKILLETTNLKIYEIARLCGFGNVKRFHAAFKEFVNSTPVQYRNK